MASDTNVICNIDSGWKIEHNMTNDDSIAIKTIWTKSHQWVN